MSLRRESRMLRLRLSGRGLADLDFWTKSDPFLTLSRPNRKGTGMVQVQDTMYRRGLQWYMYSTWRGGCRYNV